MSPVADTSAQSVTTTKEQAGPAALERLKFSYAMRLALTEKLLIALIVAVAGFLLNRALETYKAGLQEHAVRQKAAYDQQLETLRRHNAEALSAAQAKQSKELETLRRDHQNQIEAIRGDQAQQLEAFRAAVAAKSDLAQRRIAAYEAVYQSGIKIATELAIIARRNPDDAGDIRRNLLLEFAAVWQRNRLFLGQHAISKIDGFIEQLRRDEIESGSQQSVAAFQRDVNNLIESLRRDMQAEIAREEAMMRRQTLAPNPDA